MSAGVDEVADSRGGWRSRAARQVGATLSGANGPLTRRQRGWIVAILVLAAVLRLAWAIYATKAPISLTMGGDAYAYYYYGKQISSGGGYINIVGGEATAYYPVGYPTILAGLFWVVRHTPIPDNLPMAASLLNVVFSTASVGLVFALGRRLFDTTVGLVGAALLAVFPNLIYYVATTQLETTFIFLCLVLMLLVISHDWSAGIPSRARLLSFGGLLGLSALVRPFSLPFLVGLGIAALVAGVGWRKALPAVAWPMITLIIVLTPWTIRNSVALGAPLPFSTNTGDTVCMDRGPGATGGFRWAGGSACAPPGDDEVRRNSVSTRRAISYTLRHPTEELRLIPKRFTHMMAEDHDGLLAVESGGFRPFLGARLRSLLATVADAYFFVAGALALLGMPAFFRGRRADRVFVGLGILTLLVVPLGLWGNVRFHVPILPFLALAAAVPFGWAWERLRPAGAPVRDRGRQQGEGAPVRAGVEARARTVEAAIRRAR